jgi:hypothetical protein
MRRGLVARNAELVRHFDYNPLLGCITAAISEPYQPPEPNW